MVCIVTGTFPDPSKIAPLLADEIAAIHGLRDEGVVTAAYVRADHTGAVLIVQAASLEEAEERLSHLPMVKLGLLTLEFVEVAAF